jgi:flagellar M-ring protein FliF
MATHLPTVIADTARLINGGTRRFLGLGLLAGSLALLWVGSRWAAGPTFVTLYRDLELASVSSITESLTKSGIQYRLEAGGSEVMVPTSELARARVLLAKDGMPVSGRPGMELFDKPSWGMTDFTQRITYRRALEGELSRTIGTIKGVERAQVHLALPENSPLRKLDRPAEAAVVLSLRPGMMLAPDAVQGIAYIVSNSVEQLPPQNVAVMDDTGRMLSVPSDNGTFGLSTRQLDLQRSVEKQLSEKVDGFLATVLGPGHTRVQVAAQLNFEQVEKTVESYDPDGQVLSTEQKSETTNDPTGDGSGNQTIISNQYSNSKKVERIIGSTGNINRLTVAVLVDQKALGKGAPGVGASDSALTRLDGAIRNAIGLDSTRGDRLTLTSMPFDTNVAVVQKPVAEAAPKGDVLVVVERFSRPTIMLVGIAAAFVLGLRLLKAPARGTGGSGGQFASAQAALPDEPPELPSVSQQLRARIQSETADQPGTAAQVMRAWITEPAQ